MRVPRVLKNPVLGVTLGFAAAIAIPLAIASTVDPNMGFTNPEVGDPGTGYATNLRNSLTTIGAHDHTTGKGIKVPTAGININADVEFNGNDPTEVRTLRFDATGATIVASDRRALYHVAGELYYIDDAGLATQITNNGSVAGPVGTITGMTGSASVVYSPSTNTFAFTDDSGAPGGLDTGCIRIAEEVSGGKGPTLCSNAATAADFAFTFPAALPVANRLLCIDAAGDLTTCTASAASAAIVSSGLISATGAVSGASVSATGAVSGASVSATGAVTGATVAATSTVTGVGGIGLATTTGGSTKAATNTSTTSTSPGNVTGLSFTGLTGGTTYTIWCDLGASSAATTTGIQVGLDFDAGGPSNVECGTFGSGGTWDRASFNTDDGTCAFANSISTGGAPTLYSLMGEFTGATTVTVRLRSEVGASAVRITSGSTCTVAGP